MQDFKSYLSTKGLSQTSINHYVLLAGNFLKAADKKAFWESIKAPATRNAYIYAIKHYDAFAGTTEVNGYKVRPRKQQIPKSLEKMEVKKIIESGGAGMTKTLAVLILSTGMRISEALSVKITDIDFPQNRIKVLGKGNKERFVFFSPAAAKIIGDYLGARKISSLYLFPNKKGEALDRTSAATTLKRWGRAHGIKNLHPHALRHTFASSMLKNGADLFTIQKLLGHSSIATTQVYLSTDDKHLSESHARYSPV